MIRLRHLLTATLLLCLASAKAQEVTFSTNGGFYETPFELTLSCDQPDKVIRYTTNGNRPTADDPVYHAPLLLNENLYSCSDIYTIQNCPDNLWFQPESVQKCIVIRAAAFNGEGQRVSDVVTNSYFIRSLGCDTHGLPVASICADSLDLFDYERGIFVPGIHFDPSNQDNTGNYYQSGREWERPMNFEFYETDNRGINQKAGIRTHGGNGRKILQKCVKLYAREEYGKKRFKHRFFESIADSSFKHLVLKPFIATWFVAGVNNHVSNQIAAPLNLETLASRPIALYLNGEYWGIYYIHERPDERYIETHCHVDIGDINLVESWNGNCEAGSNDNFLALYDYIANHNLAEPEAYAYVESRIDIDNFIDYQILEIFTANLDWPVNNVRCWQKGNGKWRWIFFDGDICLIQRDFDAFANATYDGPNGYPSSSRSTLFFRKLLENETFKVKFINRFNQLLHSSFAYETTGQFHDQIFEALKGEIPNQSARFNIPESEPIWKFHMRGINEFLQQRKDFVEAQLHDLFLSDDYHLAIEALYPIPAQTEIHIRLRLDKTALAKIQVFDLNGRLHYDQSYAFGAEETEVIMPIHLPSGIYILKIDNILTKFVVIN